MTGRFGIGIATGLMIGLAGCTSTSTSNTARTSTEQLLISNAVDTALDDINFTPFAGSDVFLNEKYVESVDRNYLIASVRHRLFHAGARLVDSADEADVILEMRSGGMGTSSSEAYIGTPELALPGALGIPEIKVIERNRQIGLAKIGLVAYDAKTRQILGDGGIALSESNDSNWFVMGVGPWQTGSIREEVHTRTTTLPEQAPNPLPLQIAFERASPLPPEGPPSPGAESPDADVQYASWPDAESEPSVTNP